ncbi:MAG: Cof-type HAD-IIB family hydrolase [Clostridiales bacterium]|nr:Cof-type HAD-IIB family hydrolase [Clostridiales bacterium]
MSYRALFTDLDGTLLNARSEISPANKAAIADAFAAGKQVVLCSGRSWRSLDYFERALDMLKPERYGVAFQGGVVYESLSKRVLFSQKMEYEMALEIAKTLDGYGAAPLLYTDTRLTARRKTVNTEMYSRHANLPVEYIQSFDEIKDGIQKIIVEGECDELTEIAEKITPRFSGRCNIFFSASDLIEFTHIDVHKGHGMRFLAHRLGIDMKEIIAVGDQGNDIEMLREAGLGVAVANATQGAPEAADIVLEESNDKDAVSKVIREWLLK